MRTTPILLDRLNAKLKAHGVTLKRGALLEIASAALGYHNSHEMTAAARQGDLSPPKPQVLGSVSLRTGETLVVLHDTSANAPYAIDASFLDSVCSEERREYYGPSPYGELVDLSSVPDDPNRSNPAATENADIAKQIMDDLENTRNELTIARINAPDWTSWERDLKKASHKRQEPIDDEHLHRFRHAISDVHAKSSLSERHQVEYRLERFIKSHLGGLIARLDRAEEALDKAGLLPAEIQRKSRSDAAEILAAIEAAARSGAETTQEGSYLVEATRDGGHYSQVYHCQKNEDPQEVGSRLVAKAFGLSIKSSCLEEIDAECDTFNIEPVKIPGVVTIIRDALSSLPEGIDKDHPARIKLLGAIRSLMPQV